MKKVLAIALVEIRSAVRSRVVAVLLALLLLSVIGLPLTIKGDGTLSGTVQVLLQYTLGFVFVILSISTLWAGCAAIANELQQKQLHLVVTKPVHRVQIWLGKWCGLLLLNAALLALAGAVVYALLRWDTRPARLTAADQQVLREEILVARRRVRPLPISVDDAARQELIERQRQGDLPAGSPPDQFYQAIRQRMLNDAWSVAPGSVRRWTFQLPARAPTDRPLLLRYKFSSSNARRNPITCLWLAGPTGRQDRFQKIDRSAPDGIHTLLVPVSMLDPDGTLVVDCANVNPEPDTMAFAPDGGLELLEVAGGFEGNFARALLVAFFQLSFLAALAVTAGGMFSLPVAALVSGLVVLLIHIAPFLQTLAAQPTFFMQFPPGSPPSFWDGVLHWIYTGMHALVAPFQSADPLGVLAAGQLVGWSWVAATLLTSIVLGAGSLGLLTHWLLNRREIGLPS